MSHDPFPADDAEAEAARTALRVLYAAYPSGKTLNALAAALPWTTRYDNAPALLGLLERMAERGLVRCSRHNGTGRDRPAVLMSVLCPGVRVCAACGCTDLIACEGGCSWGKSGLCTECEPPTAKYRPFSPVAKAKDEP